MTAKGHIALASLSLLSIGKFTNMPLDSFLIFYAGGLFGSLLPDIDDQKSYIGRKFEIVSSVINSIFKHRTYTHYLIFPILIFLCGFYFLMGYSQIFVIGLSIGVLLHDFGDMLTKGGIVGFFWPFLSKSRVALLPRSLRFYTASIQEYILIAFLIIGHFVVWFDYFSS